MYSSYSVFLSFCCFMNRGQNLSASSKSRRSTAPTSGKPSQYPLARTITPVPSEGRKCIAVDTPESAPPCPQNHSSPSLTLSQPSPVPWLIQPSPISGPGDP